MGNIKSKRDPSTLSDAEIQLLLHKTDLSRDDILEWHKEFIEEHPDGQVNYDEFLRLYKGIINPNVEGEKFAQALFTFFDNEKNDKLAFSDFLVLTPFEVRPKQVASEEPCKKEIKEVVKVEIVENVAEEAKVEENKENKEGDNKEGEAEEKKEGEPQENKEEDKKEEVKKEEAQESKEEDKKEEVKKEEAQESKEEVKKEEAQENKEEDKKEEAQENKKGETKDGEAQENKDSDNKEVKEEKEEAKENGDEEAAKTTTTSKPLEIDDVDEKTLELALAILNERDEKIDKEELFKIPYILCETAGENAASIFETDEQFAKKKFFLFENDKLDRDEFLRLIRAAKRFAAQ